jgi:lipid-binding SYLF domain-containing protein
MAFMGRESVVKLSITKSPIIPVTLLALAFWLLPAATLPGQQPYPPGVLVEQGPEAAIVEASSQVLGEIMAPPSSGIPRALLADAQAIAILPGLLKGGFVVGIRYGRGVVVVGDGQGGWTAPTFITIAGGSFGWQIGIQATDLILVFKTKKSVQGLLRGKFTIGVDAAAAAGPVGREAAAATDAALRAEIYSYCRSRGLFAGLALDGSALQIDYAAGAHYYQAPTAPGQPVPLPPSAARLLATVAQYTGTAPPRPTPATAALLLADPAVAAPTLQRELVDSSRRLSALLDENWKRYLALPAEVYATDRQATAEALNLSLGRFNAVAANPQYQSLAQKAEFQETFNILKRYVAQQASLSAGPLPPPPPR